jgi:hypothetical protein
MNLTTERLINILQELAPGMDRSELEPRAETIAVAAVMQLRRHNGLSNEAGKYEARSRVEKLNKLAGDLGMALDWEALGTEAFRAVEAALKAKGSLKIRYRYAKCMRVKRVRTNGAADLKNIQLVMSQLSEATKAAHQKLGAIPNQQARTGRPGKEHALEIAKRCIVQFEQLTGKRASRVTKDDREAGKFVSFLGEVFEICGIDASPATAAQNAIRMAKSLTGTDKAS